MASTSDFRATAIPDKVDLRPHLWPVENIGSLMSAAAAAAVALEYHCYRIGEPATNLSTLFIDYNARLVSGNQDKAIGSTMQWVFEGIRTYGACREATWPSDQAKQTVRPPAHAYEEAKKFAGVRTEHPQYVDEAVGLGYPVPFIAWIPKRLLDEAGRTSVMPALTEAERQTIKQHLGHAMVVVGYDRTEKIYLVRNCFGERWGDGGHCRIPFDVLSSLLVSGYSMTWFIATPEAAKADGAVPTNAPSTSIAVSEIAVAGLPAASPVAADVRASEFPEKVDLRQYIWPVENVGSTFASTAAAAAAALECNCGRMGEKATNLSTLFIHYNARRLSGDQDKDTGTSMAKVMEAIRTYGACTEAAWPFDAAKVTTSPPPQAYEEAKKFAAVRTLHPADVMQAVSATYPVPFLTRIPRRCMDEAGRTGLMPDLTDEERQKIKEQPGFALVVVGYDQTNKTFLVRNSWGDKWGEGGHCRIPFDLFLSLVPKGSAYGWFIDKAEASKPGEAVVAVAPAGPASGTDDAVTGASRQMAAPASVAVEAAVPTSPAASDVYAAAIPDKVDMREYLWPVDAVGTVPAAAAAAAVVALEYHANRIGEPTTNLSTLFVHYNARRLRGEQATPGGTTMEAVMEAIALYGACREETWPFDPAKQTEQPPARAYEEAKKFAGIRYQHPRDSLEALSLHYPTPFVARIPMRCLSEAQRTGTLPAPTAEEERDQSAHPVHAMVLVGYDKTTQTFLARNCWGDKWGEKGYCRIPFDVMKVLAPDDSLSRWIISKPDTPVDARAVASAAPPAPAAASPIAPAAAAPVAPAAAPPFAAQAEVAAAAASTAQSETMASIAARMRDEIRQSLTRDIADAAKQVKERVAPPVLHQDAGTRACVMCDGTGTCRGCGGQGCALCGRTGRCRTCQ